MRYSYIFLLLTGVIASCKNDSKSKYPILDLLSHGFPIEIHAPEGAEVKVTDLGVMKDVTVKKDDYYVQIFSSEATELDASKVVDRLKNEAQNEDGFFSKMILEEPNGFIFEKKIDDRINYDFRYVKIQGDNEYVYQTGLIGTYTEDQVRDMYNSVQ